MFAYVAIVQGSTILDLTDGISYALVSYAPGVAFQSDNDLGPVYGDVTDTLTFHAIGCSVADAYAAVDAVNLLMDQAWRWTDNEGVTAVRLLTQVQESSLARPLETVIKGRAPGGPAPVLLQPTWNETIGRYIISNVQLQFVRQGELLVATAESASTTAAANPTAQTATMPSNASVSSPIKTSIAFSAAVNTVVDPMVVLTASAANRLQIYEAESATLGANVTSVADAASFARGGSVARYAPGALVSSIQLTLVGFDTTCRTIGIWAACRNNGATTFTIAYRAQNNINENAVDVAPVSVPTLGVPTFLFLGVAASPRAIGVINFDLTASAAASNMDIDYFVIHAMDDETSNAIQMSTLTGSALVIDPRTLTDPTPLITFDSGPDRAEGYAGRTPMSRGATVVSTILGHSSGNFWRIMNNPLAAVVNTTFTIDRFVAYLSPR